MMLSNTRPQNAVIAITIILGVTSGIGLVSTTSFYTGSGIIIQHLHFDLEDILIYALDPTNESVNPALVFVFNVGAPQVASGEAYMMYLSVKVSVNARSLNYTSFERSVTGAERVLTSGYNKNVTVGSTITELLDKQVLYNASSAGEWAFNVRVTMFYHLFQSRSESIRVLVFSHEGYTAG